MIYNLAQYLITNFPAYDFTVNGFQHDSPVNCINIRSTGGDLDHWYDRTEATAQILVRAHDNVIGKEQVDEVFNLMKNRFGLLLPEVIVNSVTYPEVQTAQISPIQIPESLGADDEGRFLWVFNLQIIY